MRPLCIIKIIFAEAYTSSRNHIPHTMHKRKKIDKNWNKKNEADTYTLLFVRFPRPHSLQQLGADRHVLETPPASSSQTRPLVFTGRHAAGVKTSVVDFSTIIPLYVNRFMMPVLTGGREAPLPPLGGGKGREGTGLNAPPPTPLPCLLGDEHKVAGVLWARGEGSAGLKGEGEMGRGGYFDSSLPRPPPCTETHTLHAHTRLLPFNCQPAGNWRSHYPPEKTEEK